jgi:hypothetical protein
MKRHAEGILWVASLLSLMAASKTTSKSYLSVLAALWIVSLVTVIPLHFYQAWRRLSEVVNKRQYAAWVGFETIVVVVIIGLFVYSLSSH